MNTENMIQIIVLIASIATIIGVICNSLRNFKEDILKTVSQGFLKNDERFDKIDSEIKDIHKEMKEIRTSVNRIEGAFIWKDHVFITQEPHLEKPEKLKKAK